MKQQNIFRIISGGVIAARKASSNIKIRTAEYLKDNIMDNNYVTREEYQQLRSLVIKMEGEIDSLRKKLNSPK